MPCRASSTTTASWYAKSPSARLTTKSPTSRARSCVCGPWSRSRHSTRAERTRKRHARARARRAIRRNAVAAGAGVDVLSACADRCARELAPRARALVDVAMRAQSIERCRVRVAALGLSNDGPIPRETVALERRQDRALRARPRARQVDVLDAHEPLAVRGPGVAIARDGGDQRAEMQRSGGRRREAAAGAHRAPVNVTGTPCGDGAGAYCQLRAMVAMTPVGYSGRPRLPL